MSLDQQTLKELENKLLAEKKQVEEELGRIAKPTNAMGDYSTTFNEIGSDEDENASEVEEYTDNLALESNLENQLRDIIEALQRIKDGSYGKCANCDKEISIERLQAYPAAKNCTQC